MWTIILHIINRNVSAMRKIRGTKKSDWVTGILTSGILITILFGAVQFAVKNWIDLSVSPKVQMQYSAIENFKTKRSELVSQFERDLTKIRTHFFDFLTMCNKYNQKPPKNILSQYSTENRKLVSSLITNNSGMSYYFGYGIRNLIVTELNWYQAHDNVCPSELTISEYDKMLLERETILLKIVRKKAFDPSKIETNFDKSSYF